ncbi:uncharacterized protein LOC123879230 isoform X2 [Maniola jurtina]|uniref:uncharacterized protein LOC123879230 isoform X2 n=1 Tax=Maniola jurtina TaxID=191418 RepID=UPI001E68FD54|nr:uncharacterized protein LOC123879230 isoform X2 [Maniola jurtina]
MSFNVSWDVNKYREDHESEEHWLLRKAFMERWKKDYSEERLVCLARVFFNIEFMGCRYPTEIMQEVARLSHDVAHQYRNLKKTKLQRTFVSASDAAEDRAKGIKRSGGVIIEGPSSKSKRINFVPQGHNDTTETINISDDEANDNHDTPNVIPIQNDKPNNHNETPNINNEENNEKGTTRIDPNEYFQEMLNMKCLDIRCFSERMFNSAFGRLVLLIRPWSSKLGNIQSKKGPEFGTPVDNSVATKMMKLMGWKGGGLGVDAQGIAEPIKPHLQMVNRAGLGSNSTDINQLRRAGHELMRRYIQTDTFDLDLVFSADFSKEERALLHQCAQRAGLASRSYGADADRFLVVKKKLDPFSLVRAVIEKGGNTPKYQVILPVSLRGK